MFAPEIERILTNYRTCEFATISKNNKPSTFPVTPYYDVKSGQIMVTTSIGFPEKIYNARRNPKVSLLFSNPTGSGIDSGGMVSVQGDATVDKTLTVVNGLEDFWRQMFRWQPHSQVYHQKLIGRKLFDWYYMRVCIYVRPCHVFYWQTQDFTQAPQEIIPHHVL